MDRLRGVYGLRLILFHFIRASSQTSILRVSLEHRIVVSSMKTFRGGIKHPPPRSTAVRITSIAKTSTIGDIVQLVAMPSSTFNQSVGYLSVENLILNPLN
ncbi:hypothetical protein PoB_001807700 [Plakobranchus ocellatus]|uniref:Uncharacterized protein n=1 Tax=Plakobranchus ocellatus TaxID=259542 RepID=A0AAV3ZAQ9_9GAST|nr:hypothetical protein PoB_001807700 [Plakobranchus ocellatus]